MYLSSQSLANKTILITGAAHRVGACMAKTLHEQGANIILHYRNSKTAAKQLQNELNDMRSNTAFLVQGDLLNYNQIEKIIQQATEQTGQLDVLINNASSFYATEIGTVTEQHWDDLIGANMKAPFFLSQAAFPYLASQNGCIINIVDIHADRPLKTYPVYSTAKAGLVMITKALACELGPDVRVNAIAPGAILWPEGDMDEATKEKIISRTFLKRKGNPGDIAKTALFLINDATYMSGQILTVDGGRSLNS
ncbi:MAG: pteridine reductase [Gammaproteobacteria bacterium]|nr:pteridine reductase [Gammaproteobacteria bacterium]